MNPPPPETQTLMAHHLIALLFFHQCGTRPLFAWKPHTRFSSTTEVHYSTSPLLSSLPVQVFLSSPSPSSLPQLFMLLFFHLCICIILLLFWIPPPHFVSMAGSVFSADEPLVSSGLAGREQKWLWDWGNGSLVVTDTELLWWAFNCEGQTEEGKIKPQNKRLSE